MHVSYSIRLTVPSLSTITLTLGDFAFSMARSFWGHSERGCLHADFIFNKQATTTPKVRAAFRRVNEPASVSAERFGTTEGKQSIVASRDSVHRPQPHTQPVANDTDSAQRRLLRLRCADICSCRLDDLLAVVREFLNPNAHAPGLDRCLPSGMVWGKPARSQEKRSPPKAKAFFKLYEARNNITLDVNTCLKWQNQNLSPVLFCRDDRATRCGPLSSSITTRQRPMRVAFCGTWAQTCPIRNPHHSYRNGKSSTERLFGLPQTGTKPGSMTSTTLHPSGQSQHRLTPPRSPKPT